MDAKEKQSRIDQELINAGGVKALKDKFLGYEWETWTDQSLVLSFIREHGNLTKAAYSSGFAPDAIVSWEQDNHLGFRDRVKLAYQDFGHTLEDKFTTKLMNGEIKSAAAWRMALERFLPKQYGDDPEKDDTDGKKLLDELRADNAKAKATHEAVSDAERAVDYQENGAGADDEWRVPSLNLKDRMPKDDGRRHIFLLAGRNYVGGSTWNRLAPSRRLSSTAWPGSLSRPVVNRLESPGWLRGLRKSAP